MGGPVVDYRVVGPLDDAMGALADYGEEVVTTDPYEARFTFVADGDALTLTVDDDLSVVDATKQRSS